ncbi:MAG: nucleoside-triphosphatase [Dehalococcoidia bacterium]|nr:nucleoside-triphosphatase [Dehalococcoidia bacterium]MDW8119806.1 nucleoside-triphosphatase [Chloroflexota bacterium]
MPPCAFLLTGRPGVGKTTLLRLALQRCPVQAAGFYTEEVRHKGVRIGFDLVTLDGQRVPLAREGLVSPWRVGRYGVDRDALHHIGVAAVRKALQHRILAVVDEIGRMELCSPHFVQAIDEVLHTGIPLLGTIMLKPHPVADRVKSMPGVRVVEVLPPQREAVLKQTVEWLTACGTFAEGAHAGTQRHPCTTLHTM